MKNVLLYLIAVLLLSCGSRSKDRVAVNHLTIECVTAAEKLHPAIMQSVADAIMTEDVLKKSLRAGTLNFPLSESFISVAFVVRSEDKKIYFSDSLVRISYYCFGKNAPVNEYYKGVIDMGDYKVGIFDVGGFGDRYYNADSIKHVPLSEFRPYELAFIPTTILYVENGELKLWNP